MGSVAVVHELCCSMLHGILSDQGSNLCPLHWQADPHPLGHQGNPFGCILKAGPLALLTPPRLPGNLHATPTALLTPLMLMSSIVISSVTNYHKFGGLKQDKLIILQFWRPKMCLIGLKSRAVFLLVNLVGNPLPLAFSSFKKPVSHMAWFMALSSIF